MPAVFITLLALAVMAAPTPGQSVIEVPPWTPGALEDAVAVAESGDVLLLSKGPYPSTGTMLIEGKSLTIVSDTRAEILSRIVIRSLAADQQVVLRGLSLEGTWAGFEPGPDLGAAVSIADGEGSLWIESCIISGSRGDQGGFLCFAAGLALYVGPGSTATVLRSELLGGEGAWQGPGGPFSCPTATAGGRGAFVDGGAGSFHGCTIAGGPGGGDGSGSQEEGAPGGIGLEARGADLVLADTIIAGGEGGWYCDAGFETSCAGGAGLVLADGSTLARQRCAVFGGQGGLLSLGGLGPDGADVQSGPSESITRWPDAPRRLKVDSPAAEHGAASFHYAGVTGDTIGLVLAPSWAYVPQPFQQGVLAVGSPFSNPLVLPVDAANGKQTIRFRTEALGSFPGEALDVYGQCFVQPAGGTTILSSPTLLTVLATGS